MKLFIQLLKKCLFPVIIAVFFAGFYEIYVVKVQKHVSDKWDGYISGSVFIIAVILGAYLAQMIVSAVFKWYAEKLALATESKIDDAFLPLFKRI